MGSQVIVILDNPPLDADRWADEVFQDAKLHPVSNDKIAEAMSQDPEAKKALMEQLGHSVGPIDEIAGHYRKALQTLYGDKPRLGLWGTAWLSYADHVDACVVDWSEVQKRATAPGVPESDGMTFRHQAREFVHARTQKYLNPGTLLELEPDLDRNERVAQAMAFLRQRGVV